MDKTTSRIFLIRHGKPLVSRKGLFSLETARNFLEQYDEAAVEQFDRTLAQVDFPQLERVFCSTLERSRDTARKLFGDQVTLEENVLFREFERRIFPVPMLRLPIGWWLFVSRALWFLGFNRHEIETFPQARARARLAAQLLAKEAENDGQAILVAHGLLNQFISLALTGMGWKRIRKGGRGYLGVSEFVKM